MERIDLLNDAILRAREANVPIRLNKFMRDAVWLLKKNAKLQKKELNFVEEAFDEFKSAWDLRAKSARVWWRT